MKKVAKPQFALNIMAKRKALGFKSARKFAEHIRIPYGTYRDVEAGYSEGWPQTKQAIAKGLKCAVGELYGIEESAPADEGLAPKEATTITLFDLASREDKILNAIEAIGKRLPPEDLKQVELPKEDLKLFNDVMTHWDDSSHEKRVHVAFIISGIEKHFHEFTAIRLSKRKTEMGGSAKKSRQKKSSGSRS